VQRFYYSVFPQTFAEMFPVGKLFDFNFTSDSFLWASCYFKKISIQLNLSISTVLTGFKKSGYFGKYQAESKGPGCPDGI